MGREEKSGEESREEKRKERKGWEGRGGGQKLYSMRGKEGKKANRE